MARDFILVICVCVLTIDGTPIVTREAAAHRTDIPTEIAIHKHSIGL